MNVNEYRAMMDMVVRRNGLGFTTGMTVQTGKNKIGVYYTLQKGIDRKQVAIDLALLGCFKVEPTTFGLYVEVTDLIQLAEYYFNRVVTIVYA